MKEPKFAGNIKFTLSDIEDLFKDGKFDGMVAYKKIDDLCNAIFGPLYVKYINNTNESLNVIDEKGIAQRFDRSEVTDKLIISGTFAERDYDFVKRLYNDGFDSYSIEVIDYTCNIDLFDRYKILPNFF